MLRSQITAKIEARPIRQHDIENDDVDLLGREALANVHAFCGKLHPKALFLHVTGQQPSNFEIVIDNENLRRMHGRQISEAGVRRGLTTSARRWRNSFVTKAVLGPARHPSTQKSIRLTHSDQVRPDSAPRDSRINRQR